MRGRAQVAGVRSYFGPIGGSRRVAADRLERRGAAAAGKSLDSFNSERIDMKHRVRGSLCLV